MDASKYKVGDRIRLVCMDDPFIGSQKDHVGTVTGVCPRPINVLNVKWDNGFNLNPCLDVDVVEKIGHVG